MMDIQEIREGMWGLLKPYIEDEPWKPEVVFALTNQILFYLAEKEACFPVEGELPNNPYHSSVFSDAMMSNHAAYNDGQQEMLEVGYEKVITLKEMMGGD